MTDKPYLSFDCVLGCAVEALDSGVLFDPVARIRWHPPASVRTALAAIRGFSS